MDGVSFAAGLLLLAAASVTDIRTREVPDLLSYGLIIFAVAYRLGEGLLAGSWLPVLDMLLGAFILGGVGLLMFFAGQWGGADTKLAVGLGALLGLWLGNYDALFFLLLLLFGGAVYGLGYTIMLAARNRKEFKKAFMKQLRERRTTLMRRGMLLAIFLLLVSLLFIPRSYVIPVLVLLVTVYLFFYLWLLVRSVERGILIKRYPVGKLTEGDWILEDVKARGRRICGPRDLGISKAQIAALKQHKVRSVLVKEGIPFVPSFLIAFILLPFAREGIMALMVALI